MYQQRGTRGSFGDAGDFDEDDDDENDIDFDDVDMDDDF